MHELTRAVARMLPELELRQFQDPDNRDRWNEVRSLAQQQVHDDNPSMGQGRARGSGLERVGDSWVMHYGDRADDGKRLWPRRTTEAQQQLEVAMTPLLRELTPKQAETIRLLYFSQLTEREAAQVLGRSRATVREHRDAALAKLRARITELYLTNE